MAPQGILRIPVAPTDGGTLSQPVSRLASHTSSARSRSAGLVGHNAGGVLCSVPRTRGSPRGAMAQGRMRGVASSRGRLPLLKPHPTTLGPLLLDLLEQALDAFRYFELQALLRAHSRDRRHPESAGRLVAPRAPVVASSRPARERSTHPEPGSTRSCAHSSAGNKLRARRTVYVARASPARFRSVRGSLRETLNRRLGSLALLDLALVPGLVGGVESRDLVHGDSLLTGSSERRLGRDDEVEGARITSPSMSAQRLARRGLDWTWTGLATLLSW